jgi:hypothetical protein
MSAVYLHFSLDKNENNMRSLFLNENNIEYGVYVDPLLSTYSNLHLSPKEVANLIKDYGFNTVHLVVVDASNNAASFSSL